MRALATDPAARRLEDDAAIIEMGGERLVLTHDTMVEGVHVLEGQDPADVAWKLVAVNLSDLAAKGAKPVGVLISHMLGSDDHRFIEGLEEVLRTYDVPLLGGDTVRGEGNRVWGCTAIGRATHDQVPSRGGAKPGDAIYVTGPLGAAMLGFEALRDGVERDSSAYRRPLPLVDEGQALAPHATAMMDVSDGLLLDCWRMASVSIRVAFELQSAAIPVADPSRFDDCIRWGDDYQLLFTAPPEIDLPVAVSRIGTVVAADRPQLRLDGEILSPEQGLGYQH
ncbi:thiamine-phosphate kinase [Qipengyuania qiaonensis]|uniref:Thiamine-monophosphate kinase n=1 Tax=Qipengyuania qiaonensis TaxID=2867240 RepID=A0ABS7J778_9SPHN|nr:thiamine-phosphate kinase [Qipengyuania qiaonensis]MBX7483111.1 thiamine-phosphate kinase [Qipengyuania qiaonensis]